MTRQTELKKQVQELYRGKTALQWHDLAARLAVQAEATRRNTHRPDHVAVLLAGRLAWSEEYNAFVETDGEIVSKNYLTDEPVGVRAMVEEFLQDSPEFVKLDGQQQRNSQNDLAQQIADAQKAGDVERLVELELAKARR